MMSRRLVPSPVWVPNDSLWEGWVTVGTFTVHVYALMVKNRGASGRGLWRCAQGRRELGPFLLWKRQELRHGGSASSAIQGGVVYEGVLQTLSGASGEPACFLRGSQKDTEKRRRSGVRLPDGHHADEENHSQPIKPALVFRFQMEEEGDGSRQNQLWRSQVAAARWHGSQIASESGVQKGRISENKLSNNTNGFG